MLSNFSRFGEISIRVGLFLGVFLFQILKNLQWQTSIYCMNVCIKRKKSWKKRKKNKKLTEKILKNRLFFISCFGKNKLLFVHSFLHRLASGHRHTLIDQWIDTDAGKQLNEERKKNKKKKHLDTKYFPTGNWHKVLLKQNNTFTILHEFCFYFILTKYEPKTFLIEF